MPPRVLHIVENLNRNAVESWLVRMLRHARKQKVEVNWSFYCQLGQAGEKDNEARTLGARVIHSPVPVGRKADFIRALRGELRHGNYDVLHCHHDLMSAMYLMSTVGISIPRRIVHVHNADETVPTPSRLKQSIYREPMRRVCLSLADVIVGISNHTLDTFLAGRPRRPGRDVVHYYGVDPAPFEHVTTDRVRFRRKLGLPPDTPILLFAGRVVPEKNPVFTVDVLAALRDIEPRAVAVFAGAGSQELAVVARARELGVERSLRMLGWRNDLPDVMTGCDWFILPHPERPIEGFGLAVVEAQLAGLRLLLSTGIPYDPLLPTAASRRLPLAVDLSEWAKAAVELLAAPAPSRAEALAALEQSPMNMDRALDGLLKLHA